MMLMMCVGTQRAILMHICVDDQFEVYRSDASQFPQGVDIIDPDKALIPQSGVLMRSDVEATDDTSLLYDQHDGVYGREGDMHYLRRQH